MKDVYAAEFYRAIMEGGGDVAGVCVFEGWEWSGAW